MGRGYARGVTGHKQAEKRDMTSFPRGKSEALVPRYYKFESISLQRGVSELSVPER